ncbi:MAG: UbiA family prenyltransferase [Desulfovibrionaceae bacterium]|nr:UbiA family prenyltransferase [Desulfovibrionaceae bacterium]MBF0514381.1 UbiA family prenyltransferase [Desulfovibrionaceae bacterium]
MLGRAVLLARLVKIEHSIFALPFAYTGLFLAARGWPGAWTFSLVTLAMVAIRSFAMAVNRLLDLPIDRVNPRTQRRELVTGEVGVLAAWIFTGLCAAVFVAACAGLNPLCLALSPFALVWAGLYSLTKRFTALCHVFLGSVLGLAPLAGWLAVRPSFDMTPLLFALGVTFWVAGFDILYSLQDEEFDREMGLHSIPARFGRAQALTLSTCCHVNTAIFFGLAGLSAGLSAIYFTVYALVAGVLLCEHALIGERDISRVNMAFFTLNGVVAVAVFGGALADLAWG